MIENSSSVHTIPWQTSPPVIVQREEQHFFRNHGRVLLHIFFFFTFFAPSAIFFNKNEISARAFESEHILLLGRITRSLKSYDMLQCERTVGMPI